MSEEYDDVELCPVCAPGVERQCSECGGWYVTEPTSAPDAPRDPYATIYLSRYSLSDGHRGQVGGLERPGDNVECLCDSYNNGPLVHVEFPAAVFISGAETYHIVPPREHLQLGPVASVRIERLTDDCKRVDRRLVAEKAR